MDLLYWLAAIFVIVLIGYGVVFYLNRKQANRIKEIDQRKEKMMAIPVADNLYTLKNLNLTGQTKRTYENWQATWQTITRFQYPEIEAALVSAEQHIQRMNFIKARQAVENADKLIDETEVSVEKVNLALEKLLESAQENRQHLEQSQERYNKIRKQLLAHSFTFGPAVETLEKNLNYMELDFTKFNSLTNEGDHMEAKEVLERINQDLDVMESVVEQIPELNRKIKEEYEEQIVDLQNGYQRLLDEHYVFDKANIPEMIQEIRDILKDAKDSIGLADVNEAKKKMDKAEHRIDEAYSVMENEMEAKDFIDRHQANISRRMDQVMQSNRYVLLEIDRVSQNFFLNHNELTRAQDFEEQLLKENEALRYHEKMLAEHQISYSETKAYYEKINQRLSEMDKEQSELVANLSNLRNREKEAKDAVDLFEMDMRNMKRTLEKQHLPGLPKVYLDLFFAVSDRIEEIAAKLNRVKIDIEEIEKLVAMCEEDIQQLEKNTERILDHANLTEYFIQYANRYRHENQEVEHAIGETLYLFQEEYNFEKAMQTMQATLDKVSPGAAKRVESNYFDDKKRGTF
ncbi:septation ring formation regulator EzrA [Jeotgalibaca caeni]|uniref:septation ring formation regulator EzrA n=1 Tax=Jeotgalibaca caeni TaxID=3028623 RepID=UPI00237D3B44|nr:septation ring formation regulator EzrA [Jeotgalibaca caeni]MDE1547912.1 septation ring formation regulator EzrA [Jeotgalibaca caeni]